MRRLINHPIRNQLGEYRRRVWNGQWVGRAMWPWLRQERRSSVGDVLCILSLEIAVVAIKSGQGGVDELDRVKPCLALNIDQS